MQDRPADERPDRPDAPMDRLDAWLALDRLSRADKTKIRYAVLEALEARDRRFRRLYYLSLVPAAAAGLLLGVLLARALLITPDGPGQVPGTEPGDSRRTEVVAQPENPGPGSRPDREGRSSMRPAPAPAPVVSALDRTGPIVPVSAGATVRGVVVDAHGRPMPEARISGLGDLAGATAAVDPTGHFVLHVRPQASLSGLLRVTAPAGRRLRDLVVPHEPGIPLQLRLEAGQCVEGRVVDQETGRTLLDARLELAVYLREHLLYREAATTGASGFQLPPLPRIRSQASGVTDDEPLDRVLQDISFTVTAFRPGYVTSVQVFPTEEALEQAFRTPLGLWPGGRLTVRVTTPTGRPLPGALVHLRPIRLESEAAPGIAFTYRAAKGPRTDATGAVRFEGVRPGRIQVVAAHPGAIASPGAEVDIRARETTTALLELTPGKQLGGRVTDTSGHPIPGAVVYALPVRNRADAPVQAHGPWLTGPGGRFLGTGLVPGRYDLHVFHPVPVGREAVRRVVPAVPTGQDRPAIRLERSGLDLAVDLRDARTGEPLTRADVILLGPGGRTHRNLRAGPDGRLWIRGVDPSRTALQILAPGYLPSSLERLTLPGSGGVHPVEIRLYRPSLLEGVVVDRHGRPVADALVTAGHEEVEPIRPDRRAFHSAGFLRTATTDRDGSFTLTELRVPARPGLTFELTILRPDRPPVTVQGPTLLQGESLEGVQIRLP